MQYRLHRNRLWAALPLLSLLAVNPLFAQAPAPLSPANAAQLRPAWETQAHTYTINEIAFFDADTRLATAGDDITAQVWDAGTGDNLLSLDGQLIEVRGIAVSPDAAKLVTTGFNGRAFVWDLQVSMREGSPIVQPATVYDAAFSPQGDVLALSVGNGTVQLFDPVDRSLLTTFTADALQVTRVAFSPDGVRLAAGSGFPADAVQVWDTGTGALVQTLSGHMGTVYAVDFLTDDGRQLVSASGDGTLRLWDVDDGETLTVFSGHSGAVFDADASPSGQLLASVGLDGTLRLWEVSSGEVLFQDAQAQPLTSVRFSNDGTRIATGDAAGQLRMWSLVGQPR